MPSGLATSPRMLKDAGFKELLGKFEGFGRIANVDRHNRSLTALELESALLQFFFEKLCVRPELLYQSFAFRGVEQGERGLASGDGGGGMRGGKEKRPGAQVQKLDQITRATNVAAHGANGFA